MKEAVFPFVPVIWIAIWAVRAMSGQSSGGGGTAAGPRARLQREAGGFTTWQAGVRVLMLPFVPGVFVELVSHPSAWSLVFSAAVLAACAPTTTAVLLARLLPPSLSYNLAYLTAPHWARSLPHAGAVIIVARARRLTQAQADTLLEHIRSSPYRFALSFLAWGTVQANQGRTEDARLAMRVAAYMPDIPGAEPARTLAREWLFAEAAARGDWYGAREALDGGPVSRSTRSLHKVADALESAGRPGINGQLFHRPRLALMLALRPPAPPPIAPSGPPLARARAWHARALTTRHFGDIRAAAAAWDEVLADPALRSRLSERAEALRLPESAGVLDALVAEREAELAEALVVAHRFPAAPGVLGRAGDRAWESAWRSLDDRCREFRPIGEDPRRFVPYEDVFFAFEPIRRLADAMVRDRPSEHRIVWRRVCDPVLHAGVNLINEHAHLCFGAAAFRWLRAFGEGVMTPQIESTLDNNVRIT